MKPERCAALLHSTAREDMTATEFPLDAEVRALDGALMRQEEAKDSPKVREFPPNTVFIVKGYGKHDSKRMKVLELVTSTEGWISCANRDGRAIVVPAHMVDSESPLDAVSRLRSQMGFGPKVCILGSTSFQDPQSQELTKLLAKRISDWSVPDSVIITGGMSGVQKVFAQHCVAGTRLFHLLPNDGASNYGCGEDVFGGQDLQECQKIFSLIGDCYITIEGGPSVSAEAREAFERNAPVIALRRTGGASGGKHGFPLEALQCPVFAKAAEWDALGRKDITLEQTAEAALAIVNRSIQHVRAESMKLSDLARDREEVDLSTVLTTITALKASATSKASIEVAELKPVLAAIADLKAVIAPSSAGDLSLVLMAIDDLKRAAALGPAAADLGPVLAAIADLKAAVPAAAAASTLGKAEDSVPPQCQKRCEAAEERARAAEQRSRELEAGLAALEVSAEGSEQRCRELETKLAAAHGEAQAQAAVLQRLQSRVEELEKAAEVASVAAAAAAGNRSEGARDNSAPAASAPKSGPARRHLGMFSRIERDIVGPIEDRC